MHPTTPGVNVANLRRQAFAQAQTQAVEDEIEYPVARGTGRGKKLLGFVDSNNVGQTLGFGRLDQVGHGLALMQNVGGIELQAIEVELDRALGVALNQVAEIIGQLGLGEVIDLVAEVVAQAPDGAGIGVDGLGLQTFELEVLEMDPVLPVEVLVGGAGHAGSSSRNIAESSQRTLRWMNMQSNSCQASRRLLRAAASSNIALNLARFGEPVCSTLAI